MTTTPSRARRLSREWMDRAACAGMDVPYIDLKDTRHEAEAREFATKVCASCQVLEECLAYALTTQGAAPSGVWGGLLPAQRRELHRGKVRSAS